jgi:hypothetical protein
LPLAVGGSQAAHWLAYRLLAPGGSERAHLLTATGHGYLDYLPIALAVCTAVALIAFLGQVQALVRSPGSTAGPSLSGFAALPPALFVCQEVLERAANGSDASWLVATEPTFLVGLALQVPVALLAYLCALVLLRAAEAIATVLAHARPAPAPAPASMAPATVRLPPIGILALGYPMRGPPAVPV